MEFSTEFDYQNRMETQNNDIVGIDLGTTNSLAAVVRDGLPEVYRDAAGRTLVPSCISFTSEGGVLVGVAAQARALTDPTRTLFSIKRLMGRKLADLSEARNQFPQELIDAENGVRVRVNGRDYSPEELSSLILKEVRRLAGNPAKAVITVPAYFDDAQRQATRDAGRIAGLEVLRIINEPTAAALAYGLQHATGTIAVYDLGGGTFDCSLLQIADGVFKVLSTNGDTALGGDDFDRELIEHVRQDLGIEADAELLQYLREAAVRAKIQLSDTDTTEFTLDLPERAIHYRRTFTRNQFEAILAPHIDRSLAKCQAALRDAKLKPSDITEVVLVGGSTRIPYVRRRVGEFFGRVPHTELNPDEVVALGAAVQADILAGNRRDRMLLDVIPLSLGIETLGGVVDKVVDRNITVPCQATTRYTTFVENQTAIVLNIYQGERELTKDCKLLGRFKLGGIPPMPAQMAQVDVTFRVDANGMLRVTAKEQRSGQQASVEVKAAHGLTQDEVERLVLESVDHAHADFEARRFIEFKNKADADLRHTAKALAQAGGKLTEDQRARIEATRIELERAMAGASAAELHRAVDEFGAATTPLAELLMNAAAEQLLKGTTESDMGRVTA